jgi:hypothetical protein
MSDEPQEQKQDPLRAQLDELLINVRNEAIVQTANLYLLSRQALRAGIGMGALTLESAQSLLERAVERGEIAEADAQAALERMQQERLAQADAAQTGKPTLTDRAALALADSTAAILRSLHLHCKQ